MVVLKQFLAEPKHEHQLLFQQNNTKSKYEIWWVNNLLQQTQVIY
jgi:hypothetical protein